MILWKKVGVLSLCLSILLGICCASTSKIAYAYEDEWEYAPTISVETGSTVEGYIGSASEVDVYRFSLEQGCEMKIETRVHSSAYLRYLIWDEKVGKENGLWIANQDVDYNDALGCGFDSTTYYLTKGTYYLEIKDVGWDSIATTYDIGFATKPFETVREPNDTIGQAIETQKNKVYYGLMAENDGTDMFKVPGTGSYYVTITNIDVKGKRHAPNGLLVRTYNGFGEAIKPIDEYIELESGQLLNKFVKITKKDLVYRLESHETNTNSYWHTSGKYKIAFVKKPAKISNLRVTSSTTKGIKLKWGTQPDITGYKIYQKQSGKYKLVKTVKGADVNSCTIKNVAKGNGYSFYVKAYTRVDGRNYFGNVSKKVSTIIKPAKVTKVKLKTGGKSVKASWKKTNGTGYQVVMARNVKFNKDKKVYKIKSSKTVSKKVSKLKKGKYYYVKVRAYKSYNGKTKYGPWSEAKRIKCR